MKLLTLSFLMQFLLLASIIACNSTQKPDSVAATASLVSDSPTTPKVNKVTAPVILPEKGVIHSSLNTINDPSVKYALYIPSTCDTSTRWPFLFLFDPQGKGSMVLKKYQSLAEKHKMVLLCSTTSKNGNTQDQSNYIIQQLVAEVFQIMPVDSNRIYFGGFSGGGRVASSALALYSSIKGIISIAAGSPPVNSSTCRFIGIAGRQDFNYKEVKTTVQKLTMPAMALYHNGIHEWCPSEIMDKALILFECDAMREKILSVNKEQLQTLSAISKMNAEKLQLSGNYSDAMNTLQYASECLDGLLKDDNLSHALNNLEKSVKYQNSLQEATKLDNEQTSLTQSYVKQFGQSIDWWKENMGRQNSEMNKNKNSPRYFMLKRMIATMSMQCYLYTKQEMNSGDLNKASYLTQLYKIIDPENKDAHYFSAIVAAKQNQQEIMLKELNTSIEKGFTDVELLKGESAFQTHLNTPEFNKIIEKATINQNK